MNRCATAPFHRIYQIFTVNQQPATIHFSTSPDIRQPSSLAQLIDKAGAGETPGTTVPKMARSYQVYMQHTL